MKAVHWAWITFLAVIVTACVTVNVYFPAAEAQKAANDITKDIYGPASEDQSAPVVRPRSEPQSRRSPASLDVLAMLLGVSKAHAQDADLAVSSPRIAALRQSMKARNGALAPLYRSGAIGVTRKGLLEARPGAGDAQQIAPLLAAENADRDALYREIAVANGHPEWLDNIRRTFADSWMRNGPAGLWFQDDSGNWQRK